MEAIYNKNIKVESNSTFLKMFASLFSQGYFYSYELLHPVSLHAINTRKTTTLLSLPFPMTLVSSEGRSSGCGLRAGAFSSGKARLSAGRNGLIGVWRMFFSDSNTFGSLPSSCTSYIKEGDACVSITQNSQKRPMQIHASVISQRNYAQFPEAENCLRYNRTRGFESAYLFKAR